MPRLELPKRECLHCDKPIKLICSRDLERKKFCSHGCRMLHRYKEEPWDMQPVYEKGRFADKRPIVSKSCKICGEIYMPTSSNQRWCSICVPDKRAGNRFIRYGISELKFQEILLSQGHLCPLCGIELTRNNANVDHDHACCNGSKTCGKCWRGLLCQSCNIGLHYVEREDWLDKANIYLNRS